MSIAKITLTGQEIWLQKNNQSVFDLLSLPEGIIKDDVVDNIILECGEFETLYSDPFFMRSAIGSWSKKHYRTFEKWIAALNIEYNPLENYDRQEDWTDTGDENQSGKFSDNTQTTTDSNTVSDGSSEQGGNTENQTSAFDSSDYQPADRNIIDTDETHEDEVKSNSKVVNNTSQNTTNERDTLNVHSGRIHGNIGVTTSQQMLQSEIDIARFNIIQEITNLFMTELCICVYE